MNQVSIHNNDIANVESDKYKIECEQADDENNDKICSEKIEQSTKIDQRNVDICDKNDQQPDHTDARFVKNEARNQSSIATLYVKAVEESHLMAPNTNLDAVSIISDNDGHTVLSHTIDDTDSEVGKMSPSTSWIDDSRGDDADNRSCASATSSNSAWTDIKLNEDLHGLSKNRNNSTNSTTVVQKDNVESGWLSMFKRKDSKSFKDRKTNKATKEKSSVRIAALHANSTTGLILEKRPINLPAKPKREEIKHHQQYLQILENAKKKAAKEVLLKEKIADEKNDREQFLSLAVQKWTNEIVPNWNTMRYTTVVRDLWWHGVPPSVRGSVWKLALNIDLNIAEGTFEALINKAEETLAALDLNDTKDSQNLQSDSSLAQIRLDIARTFPNIGMFQVGSPYHQKLYQILGAYSQYKPTVGYVQGMSFLAAIFLLNMEPANAFTCLVNLLEKPCQRCFYEMKTAEMSVYYQIFNALFDKILPRLYAHFMLNSITPDMYLYNWIYTLFSRSLPLDVTCRVWDLVFRDGDLFIFRTALGILLCFEDELLDMKSILIAEFLTKLPDNICHIQLFEAIKSIRISTDSYNSMLLQAPS